MDWSEYAESTLPKELFFKALLQLGMYRHIGTTYLVLLSLSGLCAMLNKWLKTLEYMYNKSVNYHTTDLVQNHWNWIVIKFSSTSLIINFKYLPQLALLN